MPICVVSSPDRPRHGRRRRLRRRRRAGDPGERRRRARRTGHWGPLLRGRIGRGRRGGGRQRRRHPLPLAPSGHGPERGTGDLGRRRRPADDHRGEARRDRARRDGPLRERRRRRPPPVHTSPHLAGRPTGRGLRGDRRHPAAGTARRGGHLRPGDRPRLRPGGGGRGHRPGHRRAPGAQPQHRPGARERPVLRDLRRGPDAGVGDGRGRHRGHPVRRGDGHGQALRRVRPGDRSGRARRRRLPARARGALRPAVRGRGRRGPRLLGDVRLSGAERHLPMPGRSAARSAPPVGVRRVRPVRPRFGPRPGGRHRRRDRPPQAGPRRPAGHAGTGARPVVVSG